MIKKSISILVLTFSCLICSGQIVDGDNVIMPIDNYRKMRIKIFQADTLQKDCDSIKADCDRDQFLCDSIIAKQDRRLIAKDSIVANLQTELKGKDQIIAILQKPKFKMHPQIWIGALCGVITMALILK